MHFHEDLDMISSDTQFYVLTGDVEYRAEGERVQVKHATLQQQVIDDQRSAQRELLTPLISITDKVDTQVAQAFIQAAQAVKLLGHR